MIGRNFLVTAETGDSDETPSCPPISSASLKPFFLSPPVFSGHAMTLSLQRGVCRKTGCELLRVH